MGVYFGSDEIALNNLFVTAVDGIGANKFVHATADRYPIPSNIENKAIIPILFKNHIWNSTFAKAQTIFNTADPTGADGIRGQIRPILTVLE